MLYNKNQFKKLNDKKVLHKVKKQWVTVSVALLGLIGVKSVAMHANANADVNADVNDAQVNHQIGNQSISSSSAKLTQKNGLGSSQVSQNVSSGMNNMSNSGANTSSAFNHNLNQLHVNIVKNVLTGNESKRPQSKSNLSKSVQTYLQNNEAYDTESSSFKGALSNGKGTQFLTANTWYRPKMIHKNGQTWVNSKSNFRPLLMNWWPDARTQYQYLDYMKKQGYLSPTYNINNDLGENELLAADDNVQDNIEKHISKQGNISDIQALFSNFVDSMPQWNKDSEDPEDNGLQGGYLEFKNNDATPNANSNYREIGRAAGYKNRHNNNNNVMEFLLGNDIDNSNPTVQAEDLNNIYYINNIGTINRNPNGNFDGIREDATGSMDYDVTDILSQYLKDEYHMNNDKNADAHLNILEDAQQFKQDIRNNAALHQDEGMLFNLRSSLLNPDGARSGSLSYLEGNDNGDLDFSHNNAPANGANPNYSRVNLHDNDSFIKPITAMYKRLVNENPNMKPSEAVYLAAKKFDDGMFQTVKPYGEYYNLPAAYAYLLTNRDTVPEVYYGDLYVGYKPYMSTKTPYYDAIVNLLKARQKYVAGGQQMKTYGNDYMSSVRFGKGADTYADHGNDSDNTRTSGIAVLIGNNPKADPKSGISIYMGGAHSNEQYQPLMISNHGGIDYSSSQRLTTNNQGYLNVPASDLQGVSNPQVSGNLSVWVPVSAPENQDARTAADTVVHTDGNVYHQNAALDSHVLYESFSPFMPINAKPSEQLDNIIAGNVPGSSEKTSQWLKDLGITDFRFPPQYNPVKHDNSFLDAIDQNGYAFQDRYDMNNSKYGTLGNMLNANSVLHSNGVHTLADLVLNQVYDLPGSEPVGVDRVNTMNAKQDPLSDIKDVLYDDKAISGTNELQAQYGGKYLSQLESEYPDLFNTKQISTGKKIDPSTAIKQWSAKYENGSNIQGRGMDYILHDDMNNGQPNGNDYYTIGNNNNVPSVFINGQPTNLAEEMASSKMIKPSSGNINQQRAEASAVTSQANANNDKPTSPMIDDNNLDSLMNSELAKSMNVPDAITNGTKADSIENSLADSIHSANPGMNSNQAMASAEQSASYALSDANIDIQRSETNSVKSTVDSVDSRFDSLFNSAENSVKAMPSDAQSSAKSLFDSSVAAQDSLLALFADNNSLINAVNSSVAAHPNSNEASIVSYVTKNANKYISGFSRASASRLNNAINSLNSAASESNSIANSSAVNVAKSATDSHENSVVDNVESINPSDINSLINRLADRISININSAISLIATSSFSDDGVLNSLASETAGIFDKSNASNLSDFVSDFDRYDSGNTFYDVIAKYGLAKLQNNSAASEGYQVLKNNPQATKQILNDLGKFNYNDASPVLNDISNVINNTAAFNDISAVSQVADYTQSAASSDASEQSKNESEALQDEYNSMMASLASNSASIQSAQNEAKRLSASASAQQNRDIASDENRAESEALQDEYNSMMASLASNSASINSARNAFNSLNNSAANSQNQDNNVPHYADNQFNRILNGLINSYTMQNLADYLASPSFADSGERPAFNRILNDLGNLPDNDNVNGDLTDINIQLNNFHGSSSSMVANKVRLLINKIKAHDSTPDTLTTYADQIGGFDGNLINDLNKGFQDIKYGNRNADYNTVLDEIIDLDMNPKNEDHDLKQIANVIDNGSGHLSDIPLLSNVAYQVRHIANVKSSARKKANQAKRRQQQNIINKHAHDMNVRNAMNMIHKHRNDVRAAEIAKSKQVKHDKIQAAKVQHDKDVARHNHIEAARAKYHYNQKHKQNIVNARKLVRQRQRQHANNIKKAAEQNKIRRVHHEQNVNRIKHNHHHITPSHHHSNNHNTDYDQIRRDFQHQHNINVIKADSLINHQNHQHNVDKLKQEENEQKVQHDRDVDKIKRAQQHQAIINRHTNRPNMYDQNERTKIIQAQHQHDANVQKIDRAQHQHDENVVKARSAAQSSASAKASSNNSSANLSYEASLEASSFSASISNSVSAEDASISAKLSSIESAESNSANYFNSLVNSYELNSDVNSIKASLSASMNSANLSNAALDISINNAINSLKNTEASLANNRTNSNNNSALLSDISVLENSENSYINKLLSAGQSNSAANSNYNSRINSIQSSLSASLSQNASASISALIASANSASNYENNYLNSLSQSALNASNSASRQYQSRIANLNASVSNSVSSADASMSNSVNALIKSVFNHSGTSHASSNSVNPNSNNGKSGSSSTPSTPSKPNSNNGKSGSSSTPSTPPKPNSNNSKNGSSSTPNTPAKPNSSSNNTSSSTPNSASEASLDASEIRNDSINVAMYSDEAMDALNNPDITNDPSLLRSAEYDRDEMNQLESNVNASTSYSDAETSHAADLDAEDAQIIDSNAQQLLTEARSSAASKSSSATNTPATPVNPSTPNNSAIPNSNNVPSSIRSNGNGSRSASNNSGSADASTTSTNSGSRSSSRPSSESSDPSTPKNNGGADDDSDSDDPSNNNSGNKDSDAGIRATADNLRNNNGTANSSNDESGNNGELPQTGESNEARAIATGLLSISAGLLAFGLGADIKHRN